VIETLKLFGLEGELKGLNDIVVNGRKISGCAQTRKNNIILQHGTFLIDFDISKITDILTPSTVKFADKSSSDVTSRMISLANILGYTPTHEQVKENIIKGFEKAFDISISNGTLSDGENNLVQELLERKYYNTEWNFRR
jgi:lipoate-protein ligase A